MVSEKYIEQRAATATQQPPPQQTFYTQERKMEYKENLAISPPLPRLSNVLFGQARQMEEFEKTPVGKTLYPHGAGVGGYEFFAGVSRVGESTVGLVFPFEEPKGEVHYPVSYWSGVAAGEVLTMYATGKALKPITEPAFEWLGEKVTSTQRYQRWAAMHRTQLTESYLEAAKAGELWHPTWQEKFIMKVTGFRPQFAYSEVSIPIGETARGLVKPETLPYTEAGWSMTEAPRTSGILLTKTATAEIAKKGLPVYFGLGKDFFSLDEAIRQEMREQEWGRATEKVQEQSYEKEIRSVNVRGAMSWRKWPTVRELMEQQKLLPFVTQTQLTRMGIFPYAPTKVTRMDIFPYAPTITAEVSTKAGTELFGAGISVVALKRFLEPPKRISRKATNVGPEQELDPTKIFISRLRTEQREKQLQKTFVPILIKPRGTSAQKFKQQVFQQQKTQQKLRLLSPLSPFPQAPTKTTPTPPPIITPPFSPSSPARLYRSMFGKWYRKQHPINTPEQLIRALGFKGGRKRR